MGVSLRNAAAVAGVITERLAITTGTLAFLTDWFRGGRTEGVVLP